MNITKDIINDLLPLYFSEECSPDTKKLVDEYLKANPAFAEQVKHFSQHTLPDAIPYPLTKEDEMNTLIKTKRLIQRRTYLMAFAIFCSLVPFSVWHTGGKTYWLFIESPTSALIYAMLGILFWAGYFITKRKTRRL